MSIQEWDLWKERQKSGHGYLSKGGNALLCAKVLYKAMCANSNEVAYWEGYQREAALSLELMAKAYLCCEVEKAPPATHDTYELWKAAGFEISSDDEWRLRRASDLLHWSSRYPAPKLSNKPSEKNFHAPYVHSATYENWKVMDRLSLDPVRRIGSLHLSKNISFDYDEIKRMYDYVLERIKLHPRSLFGR